MKEKEEFWYVVPEIELRIHESWVMLMQYCDQNLPYGDLKLEISNALPTKRLKETPSIRFDKQALPKSNGSSYIIASLDYRVHEHWINLIQWCQNYFVSGELTFKLVGAQPTELLSAKQKVRFDKPETIPCGVPLEFSK